MELTCVHGCAGKEDRYIDYPVMGFLQMMGKLLPPAYAADISTPFHVPPSPKFNLAERAQRAVSSGGCLDGVSSHPSRATIRRSAWMTDGDGGACVLGAQRYSARLWVVHADARRRRRIRRASAPPGRSRWRRGSRRAWMIRAPTDSSLRPSHDIPRAASPCHPTSTASLTPSLPPWREDNSKTADVSRHETAAAIRRTPALREHPPRSTPRAPVARYSRRRLAAMRRKECARLT